mmetsp:Transcript_60511/g.143874  ORF Transcript_60511/g.143874 Transcript_60511/m.143874 type:complete len:245 (-) Transcript_60511:50-784(-)|eukprot:CAMPEP_0180155316 /NCGR_PEP_ID=MMETSP0986-20121125/24744_1 /TAXON_ID=697907 /ORGANISM="non described non described, Strain CCMP2293" /LENGTH=244 /DNA_ID=CAMNT_0022103963 /DNA_START=16 /DNA_END=750 /DNA_ORIENTATION=+
MADAVAFPEDFPQSVKHFLFITALGMLIGSVVFLYLGLQRSKSSLAHTAVFLAAAVSCLSYYSMATGLGVEYKTTDVSPRVIFLTRYADQIVTAPLVLLVLGTLAKLETWGLASLLGCQMLSTLAALCGALVVAPFKYMWWFASAALAVLVIAQLIGMLAEANDNRKTLTYITIACTAIYPLVWLLGSEGTAAMGLSQEVGAVAITELAGKLGFGMYLLFNFEAAAGEDGEDGEPLNQASQQYV